MNRARLPIERRIVGLSKPEEFTDEYVDLQVAKVQEAVKALAHKDCDRKTALWRIVSLMDLTSLNDDDTRASTEKLVLRACNPLERDYQTYNLHTAGVCVHQPRVIDALDMLRTKPYSNLRVVTVAGDFPKGQLPFNERHKDVLEAALSDVHEIDFVINRSLVIQGKWNKLFKEIIKLRKTCGPRCAKTILSTGDYKNLEQVWRASMTAMSAGSDFIKTSTGKEEVNANLRHGVMMCEAIKEFHRLTGRRVGIKPAGGIKTTEQALEWFMLVQLNLGKEWIDKKYFRIGASSLLDDLIAQIKKEE